jgi:hypothetical protein
MFTILPNPTLFLQGLMCKHSLVIAKAEKRKILRVQWQMTERARHHRELWIPGS